MALKIQVTTAGRAALVNAANTGTLPVQVAQIGVTATAFVAAAGDLALPGELKRLVTFGGAAVADDTIHTIIRDTSADTYSLRGFGLYLADGTLFALYGQADPILEKSASAMAMLATDIIFADIDAASLTFGDASFLNPPATVDVQGVVELATDAEAIAGVDAVRAVTPKGLLAKLTALLGAGAPSAFVKTLLTAVDLVAFRTLLSIKTAASYDIGVGNGLDADLLDGQHGAYYRAYANLTGVPATFTPSAHGHAWGDLSGVPATATRWADWAEVTGKPLTFTPAPHSHAIGDVNGLQAALDARPVQTSVTSQINAAVNGLINGSPGALDTLQELATAMGNDANFAATVTNALALKAPLESPAFTTQITTPKIIGLGGAVNTDPNTLQSTLQSVWNTGSQANKPGDFYMTLNLPGASGRDMQLAWFTGSNQYAPRYRTWNDAGSWNAWRTFWTDQNFDPATKANLNGANFTGNVSAPAISASGAITCLTMNATSSDIRLKDGVKTFDPRPLHRLLAALPGTHGAITSYTHRVDHAYRIGPIAQDIERIEPAYMGTIDIEEGQVEGIAAGTYKTVDKASAAYEQAMWAGQEIDRLLKRIEALESR